MCFGIRPVGGRLKWFGGRLKRFDECEGRLKIRFKVFQTAFCFPAGLQQIRQCRRRCDAVVERPCFGLVFGGDIAPVGKYGFHARVASGLHVAFGVADVNRVLRVGMDLFARIQHGFDAGFGFAAGVAADDDGGRDGEAEFGDEFVGEAHGFVGDDAPFDAASVEFGNHFVHAVEQLGFVGITEAVCFKALLPPCCEIRMFGSHADADFQQAGYAVAGIRADFRDAFFGQVVAAQYGVECAAEV